MLLSKFNNHIRNPGHRRAASKFRVGNHNSKIETGRFTIPKTPEDLRICDHCNLNSVENELHILSPCDLYNDLRKTLFIKINDRKTLVINYIVVVECDWSTRPVTRKIDWSTPQSVQTLSIDWPSFGPLRHIFLTCLITRISRIKPY